MTVLFLKTGKRHEELEQGIALSKKAVQKDPSFGMGYATLAFAYALSGNAEDGLLNARRAVAVQPGDAFAQFVVGMNLILAREPDNALVPLSEALRLDPTEPRRPYLNVLAVAYFVTGQYTLAVEMLDRNDLRGGPTGPHMYVFRAAAYSELGREQAAREAMEKFAQSHADFPARKWLSQWLEPGDALNRTMNHLYRLGLTNQP